MLINNELKQNILKFLQNNPQEYFKAEDLVRIYNAEFSEVVNALIKLEDEKYPIVFRADAKTYMYNTPVPPRLGTAIIEVTGLKRYTPTKEIELERPKFQMSYAKLKIPKERTQPLTFLEAIEHGFENIKLNPHTERNVVMMLTLREFLMAKFGVFYTEKRVVDLWKKIFPDDSKKVA